ncbi:MULTISPECIES: hypothetical protein [Ramlibacter]|uniref:Outer membrane protein beta-barrel domain-containing protein n=1 Tax=Ramlibacter pinisoli TaxID=2682844 RepID=A0A6N8IS06_9BURK|nr:MULTISPECIES: hypothetical protein [Ramlibacter]MBA2964653.1 hypothetical protein [Ramlibacter sp. CGMCC 1.13660]MVQ29618.1 hypothetical protein [Ramlibacter pinisoli]
MSVSQLRIPPTLWAVLGACALASTPALAQDAAPGSLRPPTTSVGLNANRVSMPIGCGASLLPCGQEQASLAALRQPRSLNWAVEVGSLNLASAPRPGWWTGRQGMSLSVVGRQPLFGSSFSLYGRLGTATTTALGDTGAAMAAPVPLGEGSYGMAFGAGVSMDVTQRLSATFGVDSYDLRGPANGGPVRSTSLGLQYRY